MDAVTILYLSHRTLSLCCRSPWRTICWRPSWYMFGSALASYGTMQSNPTYSSRPAIQTDPDSAGTALPRMRSTSAVAGQSKVSTLAEFRIQYSTKQTYAPIVFYKNISRNLFTTTKVKMHRKFHCETGDN